MRNLKPLDPEIISSVLMESSTITTTLAGTDALILVGFVMIPNMMIIPGRHMAYILNIKENTSIKAALVMRTLCVVSIQSIVIPSLVM